MPLVWVLRPTAGLLAPTAFSGSPSGRMRAASRDPARRSRRLSAACPKQKAALAPREPRSPRPPAAMVKARAAAERWLRFLTRTFQREVVVRGHRNNAQQGLPWTPKTEPQPPHCLRAACACERTPARGRTPPKGSTTVHRGSSQGRTVKQRAAP